MSRVRWTIAGISFTASIGVSLYIVLTSWPAERAPAPFPLPVHALVLAIALLELCARAYKVTLSAASLRVTVRFETALRASLGGDFGAAITPARTGAEPARFLILSEAGIPSAAAILVVFAELFLEMLSLAVVATLLAVVFRDAGAMLGGVAGLVGVYAAFVIGTGVFGVILSRRNASGPPPAWAWRVGLHAGRWRAVQRSLRQLRSGIDGVRHARIGIAALALAASVVHVLLRLSILPILVYSVDLTPPLPPLVLWPLALTYGGVVAPVPAGGGFIEVAFKATVGRVLDPRFLGASLIWWRFYTFYLYIILGAIAAGRTVTRALRDDEEAETEVVVA